MDLRSVNFNPRAPCGARHQSGYELFEHKDISIHAPRVGRDGMPREKSLLSFISIHAPRVGRDETRARFDSFSESFQSTRPVWGATVLQLCPCMISASFQSTRPVWGATCCSNRDCPIEPNFNPRAPCGARLYRFRRGHRQLPISIHAPRVGRDKKIWEYPQAERYFNPRAPCGARPSGSGWETAVFEISIHAPRVGRDAESFEGQTAIAISIHAPRVGRDDVSGDHAGVAGQFQSTRPVWGATANLTILPRQICTKGTKEFLLGRKTHGKKEK